MALNPLFVVKLIHFCIFFPSKSSDLSVTVDFFCFSENFARMGSYYQY